MSVVATVVYIHTLTHTYVAETDTAYVHTHIYSRVFIRARDEYAEWWWLRCISLGTMESTLHQCTVTTPSLHHHRTDHGTTSLYRSRHRVQVHFTEIDGEYLAVDAPKLLPGNETLRQMLLEAAIVKFLSPAKRASMELKVRVRVGRWP